MWSHFPLRSYCTYHTVSNCKEGPCIILLVAPATSLVNIELSLGFPIDPNALYWFFSSEPQRQPLKPSTATEHTQEMVSEDMPEKTRN